MPTLLVSSQLITKLLGDAHRPGTTLSWAAHDAGWRVEILDGDRPAAISGEVVYYVTTGDAEFAARRFGRVLLGPTQDLLASLPNTFRLRRVEFGRFSDLSRLAGPTFVKPADPLNKVFDPGIYARAQDIRVPRGVPAETPVLVADPVEWLAEFRCFVLAGQVIATSPYLSFGRPVWKPFIQGGTVVQDSPQARTFCERLLKAPGITLPPAFVVDVGLIEDRGWAVVEFNPVWCAGLLGADPARVLPVLRRACRPVAGLSEADRRWVLTGVD